MLKGRVFFSIICIVLATNSIMSQRYTGNHIGGYSGVLGVQENPATFVNKKPVWDINLIGFGIAGYTEYGYIKDQSILSAISNGNTYNATDSIPRDYNSNTDMLFYAEPFMSSIIGYSLNTTIQGPSVAVNINGISFGIFTTVRANSSSMELPAFFEYNNLNNIVNGNSYSVNPFHINGMVWGEIGLNLAKQLTLENDHKLSIGINAKYLLGYEAFYFQNNTSYNFQRQNNNFNSIELSGEIGFASGASRTNTTYTPQVQGTGLGLDIGGEYMAYIDDEDSKSPYHYKIGLAIKDIGAIKFDQNTELHQFAINEFTSIPSSITDNRTHGYDFIKRLSNYVYDDSFQSLQSRQMKMRLPTSFNIHADVHLIDYLYGSGYITRSVTSLKNELSVPNVYMLGLRYERRWFELGTNISLMYDKWLGIGAYARLGLLTIGTDHINTYFFSQPKLRGSDIYLSLKIMPFGTGKKDKDNSRIIKSKNKKDYGCFKF